MANDARDKRHDFDGRRAWRNVGERSASCQSSLALGSPKEGVTGLDIVLLSLRRGSGSLGHAHGAARHARQGRSTATCAASASYKLETSCTRIAASSE